MDHDQKIGCDICDDKPISLILLWYHYCVHYMSDLKSISIDQRKGNKCLVCVKTFRAEDQLLYHIGVKHQMINEIRWNNNKTLLETPLQEEKNIHVEDMGLTKCELCGKSQKTKYDLLQCYSYHFQDDLKQMVEEEEQLKSLTNNAISCVICYQDFLSESVLYIHLGTVHQLVNDVLISEGIEPILPKDEELDLYLDNIENSTVNDEIFDTESEDDSDSKPSDAFTINNKLIYDTVGTVAELEVDMISNIKEDRIKHIKNDNDDKEETFDEHHEVTDTMNDKCLTKNTNNQNNANQCTVCEKVFKTKRPYKKHMEHCNRNLSLKCAHCDKTYKSRKPFEKHMLTHGTVEEESGELSENIIEARDIEKRDSVEMMLLEDSSCSVFEKSLSTF